MRTNNVCERMNCEIKRRTRVVQVFPSTASLVRLVGAVCLDRNDAWACEHNFIDKRRLEPGYEREPPRGARRRGEGPQARRGGVRQEEEGGVGYWSRLRPRATAVHHFSRRDI